MVAWCRVLLLVGVLVFFVDDDEAQAAEGEKDGRADAEDDVVGLVGELLLPNLDALGIGETGVINPQPAAEHTAQTVLHVRGEGYLRHQVEHLTPLLDGLFDKMDVDFRLAR